MKAIMQDIARLAGVSPGTVSNALNNRKGVGRNTKEKIISIANELGYYKSNPKEESKVIRFIIYKRHGYFVSDTPFFSELIEELEIECRNEGYELLVFHVSYNDDIEKIMKREKAAGVLVLATEMEEADLLPFKNLNVPIIFLDNYFKNADFDYVLINNVKGSYNITNYLIENGHTEIGYIGSTKPINNFTYRYEGFKMALLKSGLKVDCKLQVLLEPTIEGAYRDMKNKLSNNALKLPTAYFAFNDKIAFGAIKAMKEYGIKIPEQVSVVGFDDIAFCKISTPKLTTVRIYIKYIGKIAVKRLIQKISDPDDVKLKIQISNSIIERESVKKQ